MLPLLVRIDNLTTHTSQQLAFMRSPVRIGRNPLNDIVLDAGYISQWHGLVRFDESTTEFFDLGSTNGTLANGTRLEKNQALPVAGNVELRISELRFYCWRGPAPPDLLADKQAQSFGPASRTVVDAERRSRTMDVQAPGLPQVFAAVRHLAPLYDDHRKAWQQLLAGIRQLLSSLPMELQQQAIMVLQREMPTLAEEEEFRTLANDRQVAVAGTAGLQAGAAQILGEFARALVPSLTLTSLDDVEKFLVRTATTMETSARAFVELRKGYSQFGNEMAVRTVNELTPLHQARQPQDVLAYLLDLRADATERIQEFSSAYADIMIHQVALLGGMMEGVRSLLHRLGPDEIEKEVSADHFKLGPLRLPRSLWPFRSRTRWKRFVARHTEFLGEERQLSAAVFGAEFARAYAAVVGEEVQDKSNRLLTEAKPSP